MATTLIALGSNLGDKAAGIEAAIDRLASHSSVQLSAIGPMLETAPIGVPDSDNAFVNSAARFETELDASQWLALLLETEQELGRQRSVRWGARRIDLDLLLFDDLIADSAPLRVPHPRMGFRRFVMQPAVAIGADLWHPTCRCSLGELMQHLDTAANWVWWPRDQTQLPVDRIIAPNVPWHFLPSTSSPDQWRRAAQWMLERPVSGAGARVIVTDDWPGKETEADRAIREAIEIPDFPKLVVKAATANDPYESLLSLAREREPIRLMLPLETDIAHEVRLEIEAAIEAML